MVFKILKIATRRSQLAICQARYVFNELLRYYPNIKLKLVPILTTGDKIFETTSSNVLNYTKIRKGVFIKELEYALIEHQADIAVHSMKDITVPLSDGLVVPVLCKRGDPRDAFVSLRYSDISVLPIGSIIGTSSLRRQCQIKEKRPDLILKNLRGNIDTRLNKLHDGQFDAIILAVAGLTRLRLHRYIRTSIDPSDLLPAMGQGAIAIECRVNDTEIVSLLSPLYHQETSLCIQAEFAVTTYLEGYCCQLPIASYATIVEKNQIWLRALIGLPDGSKIVRAEGHAPLKQAEQLGVILAEDLLIRFKK